MGHDSGRGGGSGAAGGADGTSEDARGGRPGPDEGGEALRVARLWVNGAAVDAHQAALHVDPASRAWQVEATLPTHSPFRQEFGLSMVLADGRTAHGRARLAAAHGDDVRFDGAGGLDGTV